jgi:hypothetical protein
MLTAVLASAVALLGCANAQYVVNSEAVGREFWGEQRGQSRKCKLEESPAARAQTRAWTPPVHSDASVQASAGSLEAVRPAGCW